MTDYIRKILTARVYDVAIESPLDPMPRLTQRLGRPVLLKREDLQPVFSFKLRGAYNKMSGLQPDQIARGVVCASAGNHAQGVALAAAKLGARAVIVMPRTTLHQGRCLPGPRGRGRAARRRLRRGAGAGQDPRGRAGPDLPASLRRSGRDRRPGHHRQGDPGAAYRPDRGDLRAGGRRRARRRDRHLREVPAARHQGDRCRARGRRLHGRGARGRHPGQPAQRRPVRRRRRRAAGRRGDLPALSRAPRRGHHRGHRRHVRRGEGHLRRHPRGLRAVRGAEPRRCQALRRARGRRRHADRDLVGGEPELRPPAPHRRGAPRSANSARS